MTSALQGLNPVEIWKHFEALAKIPRGSGNEAAAREYVLAQARRLGLEPLQDAVGNLVVRKPARPGRESAVPAAVQGHLDMVCEKRPDVAHDFTRDPIALVRDGDWLKAGGTTLGADNGIGVAAGLAVMESEDIAHGPLEFVFTIDEESGLTGASEFPAGLLQAKYFLNLDGEETGTVCIGCAGGLNSSIVGKVAHRPAGPGRAWQVKVSGLLGGHSGIDIHKGRGNAVRILARVLQTLGERLAFDVADIRGGTVRNAIPRDAAALVLLDPAKQTEFEQLLAQTAADIRAELGSFDPGLQIVIEPAEHPARVLEPTDVKRIIDLLVSLPDGVLAMSPDIPGLVQTSTNVGTISINDGGKLESNTLQRSSVASSKLAAGRAVATVARLAGFQVEVRGGYPGWKPEPDSDIVRIMKQLHQELFGEPTELVAMHAGLECGVIGEKHPGMQMVSFGPQIVDPHSPNERVEISSVETFWKYLRALLERI